MKINCPLMEHGQGHVTGFRNPGRYPKKPPGFFWAKTHPKFNPVSFLILLITTEL